MVQVCFFGSKTNLAGYKNTAKTLVDINCGSQALQVASKLTS